MKDLEQFILEYCDENTHRTHKYFDHYTWVDLDNEDNIIGFISYFPLDAEEFDMVITHNKDNKYTLSHWKQLSKLLKTRYKYIVINSDPTNKTLIKGAKKYGGYFKGNDLHFPLQEEITK